MLKKIRCSTWLLLALVVVAIVVVSNISPYERVCEKSIYSGERECSEYTILLGLIVKAWVFCDIYAGGIAAIAGALVAWFTLTLRNASVEQGKLTKRSVGVAESALVDLEAPIVYCNVSKPGIELVPDLRVPMRPDLRRGDLELCVYNFGRTPAKLTRIAYEITTAVHGSICRPFDAWKNGGRELPIGTVSVNGDPFYEIEPLRFYFQEEEADKAIVNSHKSVWIAGYVRYDDIFGRHHINGFALVFDTVSKRFVRRGGTAYNYERAEKEADIPIPSSLN